jgi:hypothetical protein
MLYADWALIGARAFELFFDPPTCTPLRPQIAIESSGKVWYVA